MFSGKKIATLLAVALLFLGSVRQGAAGTTQTLQVLLVGNSCTANGDIRGQLQQIAQSAGEKIQVEQVLHGSCSLEEHARNAESLAALDRKPWDVVVLWEYSMVLASERLRRTSMLPFGRLLCERIRAKKGRPILLMIWGRSRGGAEEEMGEQVVYKDYDSLQESERAACELFSKELDVPLAVAGLAWKSVREKYPDLELYSDVMHANTAGAYLAALTIYAAIYARSPRAVTWHPAQISAEIAKKIRETTADACEQYAAAKKKAAPAAASPRL